MQKTRKNEPKDTANVAEGSSDEVYMLCDVNSAISSLSMNEWLLDSGCTFHMTPFKEILTNYKSDNFGTVSMANEKLCDVKGFGDVCLTFESDFKLTLKNVRHVPDLYHNLISCAALEEEGLEGRWGKGIMKIMKGSLTVFKAEKRKNMYVCHVKYDLLAASVLNKNDTNLWHKRLGHISVKSLELLHKHGFISGSINEIDFYDDCILGKQHKVHFPSSPSLNPVSSSCVLDYVHVDNNDKLKPRAKKCVFIGYPEGVKSPSLTLIENLQKNLCKNFEMKDLGNAKRILEQSPKTEAGTEQMKNVPYSNAIGSVMYLMVSTRPDIAYVVSCLSRYMSNAGLPYWETLKWLLMYLNGSVNTGIKFSKHADGVSLVRYVDSNYSNDRDSRRSTTSYVFTLCGACISWKSQLQNIVALSTTEAEYVATTEAFKETIWLKGTICFEPRRLLAMMKLVSGHLDLVQGGIC
ncbi:Retrovirus-related Pol polyprotein from transposon TNT 1-94 [Sesamum angolense]|uniref:Retrovirus-related Pol polyprotein from transposon TNT 1-94 n=1 Tax=Sesamum angolense TaxID=2727404 RepID=A0AAE1WD31_9LAMI|nr:Retrovirus-related Pol polyprotein from transposon TNT 1-94 [Sesamum angolense]